MNKGTAIVGFFLSFITGMFLMWGADRRSGADIHAETGTTASASDQSAASVPVTAADPQWGKADAPVTVVEISDFECPFCGRVVPTLKQIKETYGPDKVRFVFKHSPLPFHKDARPAADAAATVFGLGGNDAFWKWHDAAFAGQKSLTPENFEKWATDAGVDVGKFKAALAAKKFTSKVDDDLAFAKKVGANGTPAFRINGVTVSGAQPFDKFKEVIDAQLGEAQKLVASGVKPNDVYVQLTNKNFTAQPDKPDDSKKPPKADEEDDKSVWKVPVASDDPIRGNKDALVTIIEYSDFQCPFCKRVEDTLKQVMTTYGNDARIVWKDNPLPFHPRAKPAATLARFAYKTKGNKAFWDVHDALYESQPKLEDDDLKAIAEKNGLAWDAVKAAIDGNKFAEKIDASVDQASDFQARGTPHFFINGVRLSGAQPFEKFKATIDEQLAKAKTIAAHAPKDRIYEEIVKEGKEPPPPEKKEVPAPDATSPFKGGAKAKVVIQEFSDFQCPFCKRVEPTIQEIEKQYGDKIKFVWRHMPLPFHKDAPLAAEAAQEAFVQKGNAGFWAMHDKLFEAQGGTPGIEREGLEKVAQDVGLDMDKFKAALDSHKNKAKVDADNDIGQKAGVNGTPAFVINGYFLSGAQPTSAFVKLINRALKESGG
jgi:protein-disulfide isomerase